MKSSGENSRPSMLAGSSIMPRTGQKPAALLLCSAKKNVESEARPYSIGILHQCWYMIDRNFSSLFLFLIEFYRIRGRSVRKVTIRIDCITGGDDELGADHSELAGLASLTPDQRAAIQKILKAAPVCIYDIL